MKVETHEDLWHGRLSDHCLEPVASNTHWSSENIQKRRKTDKKILCDHLHFNFR